MGCCARVRLPRGLRLSAFRVLSSFCVCQESDEGPSAMREVGAYSL